MDAIDVREEILKCFLEVHKEFATKVSKDTRQFVEKFVKKGFRQTNGDYNNPGKESLERVVVWLVNNSPPPKEQEKALEQRNKIMSLIQSL